MTAVARLAALVDIMDHETCEVCVTRREVCVTPADARELLATIADLCPSHEACSYCGAALCVRCGIGEPPGARHDTPNRETVRDQGLVHGGHHMRPTRMH
jgi:hypothetical protein